MARCKPQYKYLEVVLPYRAEACFGILPIQSKSHSSYWTNRALNFVVVTTFLSASVAV